MTDINSVPLEVLYNVLDFLGLRDQLQVASVSRRWRAAVEDCLGRRRRLMQDDLSWLVTKDTLQTLLPRLTALRTINFDGYSRNLDLTLLHCAQLTSINLVPFRVDEASLQQLCRRCPQLQALQVPQHCSASCMAAALRLLPGLRSFELQNGTMTALSFSLLPSSLERLALTWCHLKLPAAQGSQTHRFAALRELDISGAQFGGLAPLLSACPLLEKLDIHLTDVTNKVVKQLPSWTPGLRHLDVSFCHRVKGAGLRSLSRLKELQHLNMGQLDALTDSVLDAFHRSSLLELLLGVEVYYNPIYFTADGLARLVVACHSLKLLEFLVFEEEVVQALIDTLVRDLDPERDVTLSICETVLEELPGPVPTSGPLRITTVQEAERDEHS